MCKESLRLFNNKFGTLLEREMHLATIIPLVDLKIQHHQIGLEIDSAIRRVLERGEFILGEEVEAFEEEFARFCEIKHAVGVASGTDALVLTLLGLGIGPGHVVLTTPLTFVSTVAAVLRVGAHVEFIDIDPVSYNIDATQLEEFFAVRTKQTTDGVIETRTGYRVSVMLPVHLYGQPADMDRICALAQRYRIAVVEDAAQAHGARYKGRRVGTFGAAGAFSFYPSKNLGAYGDGGAVVTNDPDLAARLRSLRNQGRRGNRYEHVAEGLNSRLDALQAAILRVKLRYLDGWNKARREAARRYDTLLGGLDCIRIPEIPAGTDSVYHLYVIRAHERSSLQQVLESRGIRTGIHYPIPVPLQPAYRRLGIAEGMYPASESAAREVLSIPMFPEIQEEQQRVVCQAITAWANDRPALARAPRGY